MGRITVFSTDGCKHCQRAKTLIAVHSTNGGTSDGTTSKAILCVEISLSQYPELRAGIQQLTGRATVPQIFFNDKYIGGITELERLAGLSRAEAGLECVITSCLHASSVWA